MEAESRLPAVPLAVSWRAAGSGTERWSRLGWQTFRGRRPVGVQHLNSLPRLGNV